MRAPLGAHLTRHGNARCLIGRLARSVCCIAARVTAAVAAVGTALAPRAAFASHPERYFVFVPCESADKAGVGCGAGTRALHAAERLAPAETLTTHDVSGEQRRGAAAAHVAVHEDDAAGAARLIDKGAARCKMVGDRARRLVLDWDAQVDDAVCLERARRRRRRVHHVRDAVAAQPPTRLGVEVWPDENAGRRLRHRLCRPGRGRRGWMRRLGSRLGKRHRRRFGRGFLLGPVHSPDGRNERLVNLDSGGLHRRL
eukprot:708301-Prymnesium_polylepis.2